MDCHRVLEVPHWVLYFGREYINLAFSAYLRPLQNVHATLRSIPPQIRTQIVVWGMYAGTRKLNSNKQPLVM